MDSVNFKTGVADVLMRLDRWCGVPGVGFAGCGVQTASLGTRFRVEFEISDVFFPGRVSHPKLPYAPELLLALATPDGFASVVEMVEPGYVRIHFDLPGCAWWFLSRYEESVIEKRDEHGRFLAAFSSIAPELYDVPLVTRWFERVEDLVRSMAGLSALPEFPVRPAPVAVTHDLDLLRKFPGPYPRVFWRAQREGRLGECVATLLGKQRDPYDSLDDLVAIHHETGVPGTWFLMGGGRHALDADYRMSDKRLHVLRSRKDFDMFGVHGSYDSYLDDQMLYAEAAVVKDALGGKLSAITRQHYLRFDNPQTLLMQAEVGFTVDATAGFADRCGFRHGWTGAFVPFHPLTGRELPMTVVPLNVMDMTLSRYERLDEHAALKRMQMLHRQSASRRGGLFVLLWHNTLADRKVHGNLWDAFEAFVRYTETRFVTLDV